MSTYPPTLLPLGAKLVGPMWQGIWPCGTPCFGPWWPPGVPLLAVGPSGKITYLQIFLEFYEKISTETFQNKISEFSAL